MYIPVSDKPLFTRVLDQIKDQSDPASDPTHMGGGQVKPCDAKFSKKKLCPHKNNTALKTHVPG